MKDFEQVRSYSHEIEAIGHNLAKFEPAIDKLVTLYYHFCYSTENLLIYPKYIQGHMSPQTCTRVCHIVSIA